VLELIRNPDNIAQWQPDVQSVELLVGERDQIGAKSRVVFEMRGFRLEMVETIVEHSPPDLFSSVYEARGVRNRVENRFFEDGPEQTRWVMANSFKFSGLMSFVEIFLRDVVPSQNLESMNRFKSFAERS
jgi:hypothetical protein